MAAYQLSGLLLLLDLKLEVSSGITSCVPPTNSGQGWEVLEHQQRSFLVAIGQSRSGDIPSFEGFQVRQPEEQSSGDCVAPAAVLSLVVGCFRDPICR